MILSSNLGKCYKYRSAYMEVSSENPSKSVRHNRPGEPRNEAPQIPLIHAAMNSQSFTWRNLSYAYNTKSSAIESSTTPSFEPQLIMGETDLPQWSTAEIDALNQRLQ